MKSPNTCGGALTSCAKRLVDLPDTTVAGENTTSGGVG